MRSAKILRFPSPVAPDPAIETIRRVMSALDAIAIGQTFEDRNDARQELEAALLAHEDAKRSARAARMLPFTRPGSASRIAPE
jgi:hypothetical protein